jgi:hypothetical protein
MGVPQAVITSIIYESCSLQRYARRVERAREKVIAIDFIQIRDF